MAINEDNLGKIREKVILELKVTKSSFKQSIPASRVTQGATSLGTEIKMQDKVYFAFLTDFEPELEPLPGTPVIITSNPDKDKESAFGRLKIKTVILVESEFDKYAIDPLSFFVDQSKSVSGFMTRLIPSAHLNEKEVKSQIDALVKQTLLKEKQTTK